MPGALMPAPYHQFFDDDGTVLDGGSVSFFLAGTTTPTPVYSQVDLDPLSSLGVTVTLDAAGRMMAFLDDALSYKVVVKRASGSTVRTQDDISPSGSGSGSMSDDSNFWMLILTW